MTRERWEAKTLHGTLYRVAIMTEHDAGRTFTRGEDASDGDIGRGLTTLYIGTFRPGQPPSPASCTDWREVTCPTRADALRWIDQNIGPAEWTRH